MYVPFTGLGLYNGFRGNAWLKNRIEIFKQFVVPSLKHQTNKNFVLWFSWRPEEKNNPIVQEFIKSMQNTFWMGSLDGIKVVSTYTGICFYDDKYPDDVARKRLANSLHGAMQTLVNVIGECDHVLMTIQPSDDIYHKDAVEGIQKVLSLHYNAVGFRRGYICNYNTKEVAEYNPQTNPPFYTIKFPRAVFIDPNEHIQYTSMKRQKGKYEPGTPLPSHEYVEDVFLGKYAIIDDLRGFMVGTHGANISTTFTNPYKGQIVDEEVLKDFGIYDVPGIKIKVGIGKKIFLKLPFKVQRKLRYWFNEKLKI